MVFKAKGAHTFKLRVTLKDGRSATCSTGTTDKRIARDVEAMVERLKQAPHGRDVLELIVTKQATLRAVYDATIHGTLESLVAEIRDVDLDPSVTEWAKRANAKYVRQVRRFIPAGERFAASRFRRKALSEFLAGLDCSGPTKNRYRAALSVFAKWLVEREVIESNPVRDVAMQKEHDPRMVWMTWGESIKVADAAPEPYRTLFRLMAATGIELGTALKLQRPDVDIEQQTVAARGSKTKWRNRVVRYERWAYSALSAHCASLVGFAPLFPGIKHKDALLAFKAAQKAVGITGHVLHDLRHTYAVNSLKQGYRPTVVAMQLGHKDASLVHRVYGRFVPDASDYETSATNSATSREKRREVKRAK